MVPEALVAFYAALNIAAGFLAIFLAIYIARKQGFHNARTFILLISAAAFYSVTNGLLIISGSLESARIFENLRWLFLAVIPPLLLIFLLDFTSRTHWLKPSWIILIFAIPLITQFIVWTNPFHGLMVQLKFSSFEPLGSYIVLGKRVFGFWFWIHAFWGYVLTFIGLLILLIDSFTSPRKSWKEFTWLFIGFLLPVVFSVCDTFQFTNPPWLKLLPFGFVLMSVAFFFVVARGQFITILPIARGYLVETLADAVFVIDYHHRIVEINPTAQHLVGKPKPEIIGKPAGEVLRKWTALTDIFKGEEEVSTALRVVQDSQGHFYDAHITPVRARRQQPQGWVLVLHEITRLKEAERRITQLAAVVEQAQETIVLTDLSGNITYANPFFETTTGYPVEDALGENIRMLQSGMQDRQVYQSLWETITQGDSWTGTFINKRKDGSLYHEAASIFPIKNEDGLITSYAAVKRDITELVIAEAAIRDFIDKLETLHEISLELSNTKSLIDMSRLAVQLGRDRLGFDRLSIWYIDMEKPEVIKGSYGVDENGKIQDQREQQIPGREDTIHRLVISGNLRTYYNPTHQVKDSQGRIIGLCESAAAALWDETRKIGYLSVDNLITGNPIHQNQREIMVLYAQTIGSLASRKRIESAIQESERSYRLLADNVLDVIWTLDFDGNFTYVSPSVKQLLAYTPEELIEIPIKNILTPDAFSETRDTFEKMVAAVRRGLSVSPSVQQLEMIRKDGSRIWVENITTSMYQNRIPYGILGVSRDISQRKFAEQELHTYARQQRLLNDITSAAIAVTDLKTTLQILADRLGELLGADGCYLTLWDEQNQVPIPQTAFGSAQQSYPQKASVIPGETTLTESVLKHGDVIIIEDILNSPYISPLHAQQFPTQSCLALPLIANNQKLGAALITFDSEHHFKPEEIKLGQQAARNISLAILKEKLLNEAKQRAVEAETLRQAGSAIVSTLQQAQTVEYILDRLNHVVPYDSASVQLLRGSEMEIVGARNFPNHEEMIGIKFPISDQTPDKIIFDTLKPLILEDAPSQYKAFRNPPHDHIRGWMGIPLILHGNLIGMLALDSHTPGRFQDDHARLASAYADQVVIALENARLFEETQRLATIDSLTNIYNRRHFMELARTEFDRAIRYQSPLSIIMFDVDHFKRVNDQYGHIIGDQVLNFVANLCLEQIRTTDILGRYGGEEFIVLLPETPLCGGEELEGCQDHPQPANIVAERLRQKVTQSTIETKLLDKKIDIRITISLGLAEIQSGDTNIETVIEFADQALLQAKSQGRDRVVSYTQKYDNQTDAN